MKLTPLDRRYVVALGVATIAMIVLAVLLLVLSGAHYSLRTVLGIVMVILWPLGAVGRALKYPPREPPHESN